MLSMGRGARSAGERINERTLTGSGGETIAPSVNAAAQVNAGSSECASTATATVDTSTMRTARRRMGPSSRRKSRSGNDTAPQYNSGGTNVRKRTSGASSTRGKFGMKANKSPPTTSTAEYGISSRSAMIRNTAEIARRIRTSSSPPMTKHIETGTSVLAGQLLLQRVDQYWRSHGDDLHASGPGSRRRAANAARLRGVSQDERSLGASAIVPNVRPRWLL